MQSNRHKAIYLFKKFCNDINLTKDLIYLRFLGKKINHTKFVEALETLQQFEFTLTHRFNEFYKKETHINFENLTNTLEMLQLPLHKFKVFNELVDE